MCVDRCIKLERIPFRVYDAPARLLTYPRNAYEFNALAADRVRSISVHNCIAYVCVCLCPLLDAMSGGSACKCVCVGVGV